MYQYLKFYDKSGNPLNFNYDPVSDTWSGTMYFDKTSVNLFDNQQIFILEEVRTGAYDGHELIIDVIPRYTFPILWNNPTVTSPDLNSPAVFGINEWVAQWTNDQDAPQIYLYTIQNQQVINQQGNVENAPFIVPSSQVAIAVDQAVPTQEYILESEWNAIPGNYISGGTVPPGMKILIKSAVCPPILGDFDLDFGSDMLVTTGCDDGDFACDDFLDFDFDDSCIGSIGGDYIPADYNDDWYIASTNPSDLPTYWSNREMDGRALQFNVVLTSTKEWIYQRPLQLLDASWPTARPFANILFWGETIGEDERLRLTLENFGRSFNQMDAFITREYDIEESMPDWQVINNKRKQLLLTGDEIFPYLGSYRGFINAIKFFGYQDLRVKEYWLNIDIASPNYGKMLQQQINGLLQDTQVTPPVSQFSNVLTYQKTAKFGLFYDITVATGDVDQYGIPITVDASQFTPEEVLIKLFALKQRLSQDFIPLDARIVDIVGEGIYFERVGIRTWEDETYIFPININQIVGLTATPSNGFIRDLRRFDIQRFSPGLDLPVDRFTNSINPYTLGQNYPPETFAGLVASIEAYYTQMNTFAFPYTGEKPYVEFDEPGIVAGCPVVFNAIINEQTWDDMVTDWDNISSLTWTNLNYGQFYEIQWTIQLTGPNPYFFTVRGPIAEYEQLPHFLPFAGNYTVIMQLYDFYNSNSIVYKDSAVVVQPRELELAVLTRFRQTDDYSWSGGASTETWDDLGASTWYFPIEGVSLQDNPSLMQLANWARYKNQEDFMVLDSDNVYRPYMASTNPNTPLLGTRFISWNAWWRMTWDDMYHQTLDMTEWHAEFMGGFRIFNPQPGDSVQVDDWPGMTFGSITSLQDAADELNASTDPGIALFQYTPRFFFGSPPTTFIHASAKQTGTQGWRFIKLTPSVSPGIYGDSHSFYKPTWLGWQYDDPYFDFLANFPLVDPAMTFIDMVDFEDTVIGATDNLVYWQQHGFIKTEPPSTEFPLGERRGHLPSWAGTGAFSNDVRVYTSDFEAPTGVTLVFICNHSEVPGKTDFHWQLINEDTGDVVIDVKGKNFLIYTFDAPTQYSVNLSCRDSNGNFSMKYFKGFATIRQRAALGTQYVPISQLDQ